MKNHHDHSHDDCDHSHNEDHKAHTSSQAEQKGRAFKISILFNFIFVWIEFYWGQKSHSLSLFGDALHNLGDVFALGLSWLAFYLSSSLATQKLSFGYKKFSILVAFFNSLVLLLTSLYIIYEAVERLRQPFVQDPQMIIIVAGIGFVINLVTALLFHKDHHHDLNIQSAYLHLLGDAVISIGVVLTGVLVYYTHWGYIDLITSCVIALFILKNTWPIFKESVQLLLNGVPRQIQYQALKEFIQNETLGLDFLDLKVWAISTSEFAMTLKLKNSKHQNFSRSALQNAIEKKFGVHDITIQID
jgi:cobalt-zinc-cadmium efflux system protein